MRSERLTRTLLAGAAMIVAIALSGCSMQTTDGPTASHASRALPAPERAVGSPYTPLTSAEITDLPVISYNSVNPGLVPSITDLADVSKVTYRLASDTVVFGVGHAKQVGLLPRLTTILNQPTLTVVEGVDGPWSKVLAPGRKSLPSTDASAPAQSAGWVKSSQLIRALVPESTIEISLSARTLTVQDAVTGAAGGTYPISVGAAESASPIGLTLITNRYQDQNQAEAGQISLLSIHSSAADAPLAGAPGGLIGLHSYPRASEGRASSHGCLRLSPAAAAAVNALPVGTVVDIRP